MMSTKLQRMEQVARQEAEQKFENAVVKDFAQKRLGLFPKLDISELHLGKELGRGQFGVVMDIQSINLNRETNVVDEDRMFLEQHCQRPSMIHPNRSESRYAVKTLRNYQPQRQTKSTIIIHARVTDDNEEEHDERTSHRHDHDSNDDADDLFLFTGLKDLAVEAHFLAALEHPHIVKLRGLSQVSPGSTGFFIVLDRLCCTLKEKIQFEWNIKMLRIQKHQQQLLLQQKRSSSKKLLRLSSSSSSKSSSSSANDGRGMMKRNKSSGHSPSKMFGKLFKRSSSSNSSVMSKSKSNYKDATLSHIHEEDLEEYEAMYKEFFMERFVVMNDLSSAILYLHNHGVMHRDIKSDNIGFDVRGDVKLFDFGASTIFDPSPNSQRPYYHMTAKVGSLSHMAPEVYYGKPYDESIDIYSLGYVFWGILSPHTSSRFSKSMSRDEFCAKVIEGGLRPSSMRESIQSDDLIWPTINTKQQDLSNLIEIMWDATPMKRPNAKQIHLILQRQYFMLKKTAMSDDSKNDSDTVTTRESTRNIKQKCSFTAGVFQGKRSSLSSQQNQQLLMVLTERKSTFCQRRFVNEAA